MYINVTCNTVVYNKKIILCYIEVINFFTDLDQVLPVCITCVNTLGYYMK